MLEQRWVRISEADRRRDATAPRRINQSASTPAVYLERRRSTSQISSSRVRAVTFCLYLTALSSGWSTSSPFKPPEQFKQRKYS